MSDITDEEWAAMKRGFGGIKPGTTVQDRKVETALAIEQARNALVEAAPAAAAQIANLARYANNERVQLDASKYIMERVLGPAGQKIEGGKSPLVEMMEGMFAEAEAIANGIEPEQGL
jgi:hypothetical protein